MRLLLVLVVCTLYSFAPPTLKIAKLKYNGGGDWYANKTSLPNLIRFCNQQIGTNIALEEEIVEASSSDIFNYPSYRAWQYCVERCRI
jgi:hypothetical protein